MDENTPVSGAPVSHPIDANRTRIGALYARGLIGLSEYEALGRLHGFVRPAPASTAGQMRTAAVWVGYAMLVLGAVAQVIAARRPDLKGPLDTLLEVANLVGAGL